MFTIRISPDENHSSQSAQSSQLSAAALEFAQKHDSKTQYKRTTRPPDINAPLISSQLPVFTSPANAITRAPQSLSLPPKSLYPKYPNVLLSPRSQRNPQNRIPSKLFNDMHTDKFGFLLPPIANPDLPTSLTDRGDSFWISERENSVLRIKENIAKRQKRLLKKRNQVQIEEINPLSEEEWSSDIEEEIVTVVGKDGNEGNKEHISVKYHPIDVIDAALSLAGHIAERRQNNNSQTSSQKSTSQYTNQSTNQIQVEEIIDEYKNLATNQ